MHRTCRGGLRALLAALAPLVLVLTALSVPATAAPAPLVDRDLARSPELSEATRLAERRFVVTGDRAWALGSADGRYPASGFHTRGEMGGFWLPNLKLLDGMWFGINGDWIGPATKTTSGWGYVRADLPTTNGVRASRTDFVPDGVSGALVGLSLQANRTRTIRCPSTPIRSCSAPTRGGRPPQPAHREPAATPSPRSAHTWSSATRAPRRTPTAECHDWAAAVGSNLSPTDAQTGEVFRGPQDPAVICPASGPNAPPQPELCDDTEYGKGVGGQLTYSVRLRAGEVRTVWFGVGGSAEGPDEARRQLRGAPGRPGGRAGRQGAPSAPGSTGVRSSTCPGTGCSRTACAGPSRCSPPRCRRSRTPRLRWVDAGRQYPPPSRHAGLHALARRRLARLHLAVRHRRRVHRVRLGRGRAVRPDQGPLAGAARRVEA